MLSALLYGALRTTGVISLARYASSGGVILCYHNVVSRSDLSGDPGLHLSVEVFAHQVRWLSNSYDVISLRELASRLEAGRSTRRTAVITFDDAYGGVFEHAWPLLRAAGLPATVFVPTDPMLRDDGFWWDHPTVVRRATPPRRAAWLSAFQGDGRLIARAVANHQPSGLPASHRRAPWSVIARAAREGLDLGTHSCSHRNLVRLWGEELRTELEGSRAALFAHTGIEAVGFAYPYGSFDVRVRDAVRRAGYRTAVTLDFGLNRAPADPLALARVNVPASISVPAFQAWATGLRLRGDT